MRLIDADRLIKDRVENDPVAIAAKCEPTAYDLEKVVEQLNEMRVYQFQGMLPDGRVCHFSDAIEIVKAGGSNG